MRLSAAAAKLYGVEELRNGDVQEILNGFPQTELDDDLDCGFWPVMGCLWCTSPDRLLERFNTASPDGKEEDLWGNAGTFSIYWYKAAALLLRLRAEDSPRFDEDVDLSGG